MYDKFQGLLRPISETYIPGLALFGPPPHVVGEKELLPEEWEGKGAIDHPPTLYVCRGFSCLTVLYK